MTGFAWSRSMLPVTAVLITRGKSYPTDVELNESFDETLIERDCPHVLRRYEVALTARNEHIYFQDDDAVIDIKALWTHYDGGHITHAITPGHAQIYRGSGVTLIGWGSFFPKRMVIDFLKREPELRRLFGDQIFEMECDRMFTYLNQPHNSILMPIKQFQRPVRMSDRPDHYKIRQQVFDKLKELR